MKQVVLAVMTILTLTGPASATSDWDYFWGTTVHTALDPKLNGWDDFWGTCQNPDKNAGDCIGVIATGIGMVVAIPVVAIAAVAGIGGVASTMAGTGSGAAIIGFAPGTVITYGPGGGVVTVGATVVAF